MGKEIFSAIGDLDDVISYSLNLDLSNIVIKMENNKNYINQRLYVSENYELILEVEVCKEE
jgi:hypothetical protein